MVRPGDRTSLKAGGDACAPGQRPSKSPLKGDLLQTIKYKYTTIPTAQSPLGDLLQKRLYGTTKT